MEQEPNHYKLLMVDPNADAELIRRAYKYLAAKYHPDNKTTGNKEKFDALEDAWKILSDEKRRDEYNLAVLEATLKLEFTIRSAYVEVKMLLDPASRSMEFLPETLRSVEKKLRKSLGLCREIGSTRRENDAPSGPLECSFCSKKEDEVDQLIAGPGVNACNLCVGTFNGYLGDPNYLGAQDAKCSFCGKRTGDVKKLISGPKERICDECVGLCNEILQEEKKTL
jgi:hypothetical protein